MVVRFPIVGIGASAGGLASFSELLSHLPDDTGMAFVLVQHLDPLHESRLDEVLSKLTNMSVRQIEDGTEIGPNQIYIIPAGHDLSLSDNTLHLIEIQKNNHQLHLPIDRFFKDLADSRKNQAIGVILSGNGSDGTVGLTAIRNEGGIGIVQDPSSALHSGMPQSALLAGSADYCLGIPQIAEELVLLSKHPYLLRNSPRSKKSAEGQSSLQEIYQELQSVVHIDFRKYKLATVGRRLSRRMAVLKMENSNVYVQYLKNNPLEAQILSEDFLIHVTSFFRDDAVFQYLKKEVFPKLMSSKKERNAVRIWVPGCSTGEEVYSIAMNLIEYLGDKFASTPVQIFGSDLSSQSIEKARFGFYTEAEVEVLSPVQLKKYFAKVPGGYRVNQVLRSLCIFVQHNLLTEPPFSKVDLISCRNVFIFKQHYRGKRFQSFIMRSIHLDFCFWGIQKMCLAWQDIFLKRMPICDSIPELRAKDHPLFKKFPNQSHY